MKYTNMSDVLQEAIASMTTSGNNHCKITFDKENIVIFAEDYAEPQQYPDNDSTFYNSGNLRQSVDRAFDLVKSHYELNEIYMVELFFDGKHGSIDVGGYRVEKEDFIIIPI
jgi:hypothetical protein